MVTEETLFQDLTLQKKEGGVRLTAPAVKGDNLSPQPGTFPITKTARLVHISLCWTTAQAERKAERKKTGGSGAGKEDVSVNIRFTRERHKGINKEEICKK